jgi:hypothetical protein
MKNRNDYHATDGKVIKLLQTPDGWKNVLPVTGAGDIVARAPEIAERGSLDKHAVIESLERLESLGRVRNTGGTFEDSAPRWHIIRR